MSSLSFLLSIAGRQQGDQTAGDQRGQGVVDRRRQALEHQTREQHDDCEVDQIVVKDRVVGRLVVGHLVFLRQYLVVLLFAGQLVVRVDLASNGFLAFLGDLVLEVELAVSIRQDHQVGGEQGHDRVQDGILVEVQMLDLPEEPWMVENDWQRILIQFVLQIKFKEQNDHHKMTVICLTSHQTNKTYKSVTPTQAGRRSRK